MDCWLLVCQNKCVFSLGSFRVSWWIFSRSEKISAIRVCTQTVNLRLRGPFTSLQCWAEGSCAFRNAKETMKWCCCLSFAAQMKLNTVWARRAVLWGVLARFYLPCLPLPPPAAHCGVGPFCPELLGHVIRKCYSNILVKTDSCSQAGAQHLHP